MYTTAPVITRAHTYHRITVTQINNEITTASKKQVRLYNYLHTYTKLTSLPAVTWQEGRVARRDSHAHTAR